MIPPVFDPLPAVLPLADLHPRLVRMIHEILRHQHILTAYETGALVLHFNGRVVKAQMDKVALNSCLQHDSP